VHEKTAMCRGGSADGFISEISTHPAVLPAPCPFLLIGIMGGRRPAIPREGNLHGHVLRGLIRRGESGPGGAARREKSRERLPRPEGDQHGYLLPRGDHGGKDGGSADTDGNLSGDGNAADRCIPAQSHGDGDLRPGLILGSRLPVRESRRRSPHPRRIHGGVDGEPHVSEPRGPYRDGRGRLRSVRDLLRDIARRLLGKP
jgi:hypothetical protein